MDCKRSNDSWVQLLAKTPYLNSWLRVKAVVKFSLLFPFKKYKINNSLNIFCQSYSPDHQSLYNYFRMFHYAQAVLIELTSQSPLISRSTSLATVSLHSCCFYYLDSSTEEKHVGRRNNHSLTWNISFTESHRSFHWFNKKWKENPRPDFL